MNIKFGKRQIDYCDRRGKPSMQLVSKPCRVCCGPLFSPLAKKVGASEGGGLSQLFS